jgi:CRP-like cAMP-binding protein
MLRITKEEFDKLSKEPLGGIIKRIASEVAFVDKQQQQIDLLTKTALQRYETLLEKFPDIIKRTKQKHIASYLGITPQSLSRIRKMVR